MIKITKKKEYVPGDRVRCILSNNSSLNKDREYIVDEFKHERVYLLDSEPHDYIAGTGFNPARFVSTKEIREGKINKILEK